MRFLIVLSLFGATAGLVLALTTASTRGLIWLAPLLTAIGTNAWNAVAHYQTIRNSAGSADPG